MSLCIAIGTSAHANGFCCVSVGNNTKSLGAFDVDFNEDITLPDVGEETSKEIVSTLRATLQAYQAMVRQDFAPRAFCDKAEKAIAYAIKVIEQH
jgi:hypothetical protein